jgi:putative photosynthetic complex assembly protein
MSDHIHTQAVPRGALIGAAFLMIGTIAVAAGARSARLAAPPAVPPAVAVAEIRFEDRPDGSLAVLDAHTGHEDLVLAPGSNNFIRGVLRGMFRSRKLESLGHDGTFRLSQEADGSLTLEDPQTARVVNLDSFGPSNANAFHDVMNAALRNQAIANPPAK